MLINQNQNPNINNQYLKSIFTLEKIQIGYLLKIFFIIIVLILFLDYF